MSITRHRRPPGRGCRVAIATAATSPRDDGRGITAFASAIGEYPGRRSMRSGDGRRLAAGDGVHVLHAGGDPSPDRVLAVQEVAVTRTMMKNWLLPEFGLWLRAMPTTPGQTAVSRTPPAGQGGWSRRCRRGRG